MIGMLYLHKKTHERMRIVKLTEGVATCERIDKEKVWYSMLQVYKYPCAICLFENLEEIKE